MESAPSHLVRPKSAFKETDRVSEFAVQLDAIRFWDRFDGRWLRGEEFIYPDRPHGLPRLREPGDMDRLGRRPRIR